MPEISLLPIYRLYLCFSVRHVVRFYQKRMNSTEGPAYYLCPLRIVASVRHRADRVLGFFSSRPNWDPPTPLTRKRVCAPLPHFGSEGEGHTRLREMGWGSPNSDEGTDTVYSKYIYVLCGIRVALKLFFANT
jgi:hypothetical protein